MTQTITSALIWLFKDFIYSIYDWMENKFTLQFDAPYPTPNSYSDGSGAWSSASPFVLNDGVVGTPYGSAFSYGGPTPGTIQTLSNLQIWVNVAGGLVNFENMPPIWYPIGYSVISGSLPLGLSLSPPSEIPTPNPTPPPYNNEFAIVGTPTTAGVYQFTIRWTIPEDDPEPITINSTYEITINPNPTPPKKKIKKFIPSPVICCDPKSFKDGICPPKVSMNGYVYERIANTNCYILIRRRK